MVLDVILSVGVDLLGCGIKPLKPVLATTMVSDIDWGYVAHRYIFILIGRNRTPPEI